MENEENVSSSKKKRKFRWVKPVAAVVACALVVGATAHFKYGFGLNSIKNLFNKKGTANFSVSETFPLSEDGVISITFPMVDRTDDLYSIPNGFEAYYVKDESDKKELLK